MAAHSCNASAVHRTRWWIILTTAHAPRFPRKVSNSEPESSRTSPSGSHPDLKQWATIAVGNRGTWQFRVSECYHDSDSDSQPCILYHCDEPERLQLRLPFTSPGVVGGVATIPDDSDSDSEPLLDIMTSTPIRSPDCYCGPGCVSIVQCPYVCEFDGPGPGSFSRLRTRHGGCSRDLDPRSDPKVNIWPHPL